MRRVLLFAAFALCLTANVKAQSSKPALKAQAAQPATTASTSPRAVQAARASFAKLPLSFEENVGQTDGRVKYTSRGAGYNLFLTADEAIFALRGGSASANCTSPAEKIHPNCADSSKNKSEGSVLWLKMMGANASAQVLGSDALPGKINYYVGNDPTKWRTGVRQFGRVGYRGIYPGVDLTYYGNQQQVESDFVVAPGADPAQIQFEIQGADRLRLDPQGNLVMGTIAGEVRLLRPGIYQMVKGTRREVAGHYVLRAENRIGFEVAPYDASHPLIIDPVLVYATFLGGSGLSGDTGNSIALDASGNAYVTGRTTSADFPGLVLFPPSQQFFFFQNTFVSKFNPAGNQLVYSTIIGGNSFNSNEGANGIGVDGAGNAYIAGTTGASNFPTVNPFQATAGAGFETAFVAKIAPDGASLVYSTYFGGRNSTDDDQGNGIFVESSGNAYVVGNTTSSNFPTVSPMQATLNGFKNAFVAKFNPSGQPIFSTYLGGNGSDSGMAIAADSNHRAYVTGQTSSSNLPGVSGGFQSTLKGTNAFVSRFSSDGAALEYSTYLGGANESSDGGDVGLGIAVDSTFDAYVTGQTDSTTFPLQNPIQSTFAGTNVTHAFVTKLNPTGTAPLLYSTFLGGEKTDSATGIALDGATPPNAYVTGATSSTAFNLVKPMQAALAGAQNAFITRVNGAGTAFDYSTYLGGNGSDQGNGIAVNPATGNAYITGVTNSPNFPVLGPFQASLLTSPGNAFVAEISPNTPATVSLFPPAFSFGQIGVGQTSFSEPVTLSNFSGSTVTINSISFTGANPGDFAQTNNCGAALANNATCIVTVTFSPTLQDTRTATLSVSDTGTGSPHTMAVSGFGAVPEVSLSSTAINFGSQPLNFPTFNGVLVTNTGGVPLHISTIQFSGANAGDFSAPGCPTVIAPGQVCFLSISFTPAAAGARSATLLINDDAAGSPQTLPLTGTGVAEVLVLPTTINFGSQIVTVASFESQITMINGSGVPVTLTNFTFGGANPGDFPADLANTTCSASLVLAPGAGCKVEVKFVPTAAGARAATVTFNYTGFAGSPQVVNLTGIGLSGVSLSQTSLNFGNQFIGFTTPLSDVLYNGTNASITVSSIVIGGTNPADFGATLDSSCAPGGVVPANTSCLVNMTFTPTALGARSATATISFTGAAGSPLVANLTGTGVPGPVTLSKPILTFGGEIINTTSPPQRIILSNLSTLDLHIATITTGGTIFSLAPTSTCLSGGTVKARTTCVVDVIFTPTALGAATATLTFTDDGPGSPRNVPLSGVGEPSVVSVSTTTLDFGNQTVGQKSTARSVFLINAGSTPITVTITGTPVSGTNAGDFAIDASTSCVNAGHVTGSGGTCAVALTFTPGGQGARTATLSFSDNIGGAHSITLIGNGILTPALQLSSNSISFSVPPQFLPTLVGTTSPVQTVTVTNTGNGPLTISNVSLGGTNPGEFTLAGTTCTNTTVLNAFPGPGNTCLVSAALSPTQAGFPNATVNIISNSNNIPNTQASIGLSGQAIASGVTISPASFDFGAVALGAASNSQFFTLTNNTATALTVTSATSTGTNPADFTVSNFCFSAVTAFGGTCSIGVSFQPSVAASRSANLHIVFTGPAGSPIDVNLTGTGSSSVALSPSAASFGTVSLTTGFVSPIGVMISNGTTSSVTITNVPTITGTNAGDFNIQSFSGCVQTTVLTASGGSCQFSVGFTPTARGSRTAQIVFNLSAGGPLTLNLSATVTGPVMSLSPSPLNFPSQTVNTQSSSMLVTISNTGDDILSLSKETLTGANGNDFSFPSFISCFSIAPGTSCAISIAFTPSGTGPRTGLLTVTPFTAPASQTVVLNGTGQAGTVSATPTTLTFASQNVGTTSGSQAVLLKNTSNAPVTLTTVALSGTNSGDYAIAAGTTCTVSAAIPALTGTCIVNITFSPTGTANPRTATLTVTDNVFGAHPVSLSGTGANPNVSVSPTSLTFAGSQLLGTQSSPMPVTVTNGTAASITISSTPTVSGDFLLGANTCTNGAIVTAGNTCTVNVIFQPTATGTRTGTLQISDATDGNSPHNISLSGTGIAIDVTIAKSHVGNFLVGQTGTYTITVTNTGGAPTTGTTTVTDTLPAGMTFNSNTNGGTWSCVAGAPVTCTSSAAIAANNGASAFNLVVNVAAAAAGTPTNSASVTTVGDTGTTNKTSGDPTTVSFPLPTITSLSPTSATAGAAGFTLTVNGTNYVSGSVVNFNGTATTTTFVSAAQLTASITAAEIATAGTFNVTVTNPAPGGGTSGSSPFTVNNPAPTVTTLSPSSATVGGVAFTLTVNGTNFNHSTVVTFNGTARTTTFVSVTQVTIQVTTGDIAALGSLPLSVTNPAPGGGTSGTVNLPVTNPPPVITTIAPTSATAGGAGFTLTVNGTGFVTGATVNFNGVARTTTFVNSTQVTAAILAGDIATAGTFNVTVTNPAPGGGTSGNSPFTVNNPLPTLTSLSPTSTLAGGAAFTLTVNGTNFNSSSVVNFNGTAKTTTFVNATQVTASIAAPDIATAGTFNVTVTNPAPGGGTSTTSPFTVNNPAPTITSLSPNTAATGGPAFTLTVNGTGFVASSSVKFNGTARTTTFVNATQITAAITPADIAAAGSFNVTVTNPAPGGGTSGNSPFAVNNPLPAITSISPASATAGGAAFTLTVNGTGFVSGATVSFNGSNKTTTFVSATQVTAAITVADIATAGSFNVTVTNPAPGGGTSGNSPFAVNNPLPTITTLSPASATVGGAGFTLTVNGTKFISGSVVNFNGNPKTTTFVSATQVTAAITAGDLVTAGSINVTVTNPAPGGGTSGNSPVAINNPAPTVTSLSPNGATAGGAGFTLTVNGTSFVPTSVVNFNGAAKTTTFVSATKLTASILSSDISAVGGVNVTVTNPAPGGGTTTNFVFTIASQPNPAPTLTSISPTSGVAGQSVNMTLTGTGFIAGSIVNFGGSGDTGGTASNGGTTITITIPAAQLSVGGPVNVTVTNPLPGGGTSAAQTFTINNPSPVITTLSPTSATVGGAAFTLTVNGTGFVSSSVVNFNGAAKATAFVSATQLTAAITPADIATVGSFPVTVTNPAPGGGTSGSSTFAVNNPAPSITTLSPTSATAGGPAFSLTVNGTGFVSSSIVNFNGAAKATTFVNATQLTAAITVGDIATAGTLSVTVTNPAPGGGTSASSPFTVNNPLPAITSLSPTSALAGGTAFTLTVNGSNFNSSSVVNFNGTAAATTFVSASQITAAITGAEIATAGSFNVTVTNPAPGGGTSANSPFAVSNPVPTITSLSPTSASAGGAAFTLTVNGTNFVASSVVNFNGAAKTTTFVSATKVTASITVADIATAGTFNVTVTNPAPGGGTSANSPFVVNNPAPTITSLSPASAVKGGVAFTLTVNGTNFVSTSVVNFSGTAKATTFVSATQLTASIAAADIAAAGSFNVTVTSPAPGGGTSANSPFAVNNPVPTITSLSPAGVTVGGAGFTLTVNGTGFLSGAAVTFNGNSRLTTFVSATQVTAAITAPDIATAGTFNVTVTNPAPTAGPSAAQPFNVNNPLPAITSLSPTTATAGGATFTLTVNGTNFVSTSAVNFNGTAAATTFVSSTQVTASITAAEIATAGTFNVTVTNPAPGGGASGNSPFTVNNPLPTLVSLSPTSATKGAAFTLTVTGTNFNSASVLNFNGVAKATTFLSATQVKASITATDTAASGTINVTVTNPAPGGGTSSTQPFQIVAITGTQDPSTPGTITVNAGTPAMVKIDFTTTPANSPLPSALTVTCTVPQSLTGATCSANPSSIPANTMSASSTITINAIPTTKPAGSEISAPNMGGGSPWSTYLLWFVAAAILSMLGMLGAVRQRALPLRRAPAYLALLLLVLAAGALVGCTTSMSGPTPTPTGPSTITVTATTADGAMVSTTVNITVSN
jgi:hypothetical protein